MSMLAGMAGGIVIRAGMFMLVSYVTRVMTLSRLWLLGILAVVAFIHPVNRLSCLRSLGLLSWLSF